MPWMRWWDADGNLVLTGHEMAKIEADRLAAQLRDLNIEPEA